MLSNIQHTFTASFITAPDDYLSSLEKEEYNYLTEFKDSFWIWPTANVRGHLTRAFKLDFKPDQARLEFIYDHKFDLYLNGEEFTSEKYGNMYRIISYDAAQFLNTDINRIALRLYQTNSYLSFSSAVRGGIRVTGEGKELTVVTDSSFKAWLVCGFYEQNEPEGWYLMDELNDLIWLGCNKLHPKYLRRSCIFKKNFVCNKEIKNATLFATADGLYEPMINGRVFDAARFLPGSKDKVKEYQAFDVTGELKLGENELCFTLGNGWLNSQSWGWLFDKKPALLAELIIEYYDGSTEIVKSDESFTVYRSPLLENDLQFGERYDARLEELPKVCATAAACEKKVTLVPQDYPPIRVTKLEKCRKLSLLSEGVYLYDFGTNGAGRVKLTLKNTKRGEVIRIRYAEFIKKDGRPHLGPYQETYFQDDTKEGGVAEYAAKNLDVYICRGDAEETYIPRFTFTGFRFIYIEGYSGEYTQDTVERAIMHNDLAEIGDIDTDNEDIAVIWDTIKRTYRSNIFTGPIDCPTREKNFWNGDTQAFSTTACWYMDNKDFLSSWSHTGRKLEYGIYGYEDEEFILPLVLYKFYGDPDVIRAKYPIVNALIEKRVATIAEGEIFPDKKYAKYCDWKSIINISPDFHTAMYYTYMYRCAAHMAKILGIHDDETQYIETFKSLKAEFNRRYYLDGEKRYVEESQSGQVLPIALGLAPENDIPEIVKALHGYVLDADYHMTTGFMGSEHILGILSDYGYEDDAIKLILQRTYPSLLNLIGTGATTMTENWEGLVEYDDIRAYDSMNHFAFGVPGRWIFEYLGGIRILKAGFERILLSPTPYKEIGRLRATHKSPMGLIETEISYNANDDTFTYSYVIPHGIEAFIRLPGTEQRRLSNERGSITFTA